MRLCLTGDVMTGRGIDQILAHPGDPAIVEPWLTSAVAYVELAEARSGPLPRRVPASYVWGDLLGVLDELAPDAFVVNLETAVTDRGEPWPDKAIQYRMHPANVDCLTAAGIDVAVLANNHVLDWSVPGLEQTLEVLAAAGIRTVGAGRNHDEAWEPAVIHTPEGRVVVVAAGTRSSGIPARWAVRAARPGVALLDDLSGREVDRIAGIVAARARSGDVVVASLHWGGNWGYEIPPEHRRFAHELIDRAGVHVVHGHSSHHTLGIEVHEGCLIIYGCGDLVTDYEGIGGHDELRGDLGALFVPTIDSASGVLVGLDLVPTHLRRFRLTRPTAEDLDWLAATMSREGEPFATSMEVGTDGLLHLRW